MPRVQFSDVVPPEKRSIRNIPISTSRKNRPPLLRVPENRQNGQNININKATENAPLENLSEIGGGETIEKTDAFAPKDDYFFYDKKPPGKTSNRNRLIFGSAIFVVVIGFIITMMTVFSSAKVEVTPKRQPLPISTSIQATTEIATSSVRYETIKLSKTKSLVVDAKGEEMVERRAQGKITIYNNFSTEPQRLITRTRFESESGLIYRIPESIIVPGQTKSANGALVPGSIEVTVVADEPGDKYNVEKANFTIPGFKNDPKRYAGFTAKTSLIEGGFIGKIRTIDTIQKTTALLKIETELTEELKKEVLAQIPNELIALTGSMVFNFKELPQQDSDSTATLSKEGTVYVFAINKESLSSKLIATEVSKIKEWENIPAVIKNLDGLRIETSLKLDDLASTKPLSLKLTGAALIEALLDLDLLSSKLAGISRDSISEVATNQPGILGIKATIRPMWKRSFPSSQSKIYIQIKE